MLKFITFLLPLLLLLTACSTQHEKPLKISVNSWIGYSPLFYAYDKGWLKESNIKVVNVVSLAESVSIYNAKNADAFTGTQYEYKIVKEKYSSLTPLMMLDRSFGGDMVMSNRSLQELKQSTMTIDAYLEMGSINQEVLKDFISFHGLDKTKIKYINKNQNDIAHLKSDNYKNPILIVTYAPYDIILGKHGFKTVASTKDGLAITVIDALFASQDIYIEHKKQFKVLKEKTDKAIEVLNSDPKEFYAHVKPYLQDISYEEFQATLHDVKWINKSISPELKQQIQKINFPLDGLI